MLDTTEFIIQTLVENGDMTVASADRLREYIAEKEVGFDEAVIRSNIVEPRAVAIVKSMICEYPFIDIKKFDIDIRQSRTMPKSMSERLRAFPLFIFGEIATVAMEDPLDLHAIDEIRQTLKKEIDPVVCDAQQLRMLITRAYTLDTGVPEADQGEDEARFDNSNEPIVAAVNQILFNAAELNASDIHINPDDKSLLLRYRVDGVLQPQRGPDIGMHEGLIQRLKVMSHLDVTQSRRPQDGKFRFKHNGIPVDVRLSILPTIHGENAVMRLLSNASQIGQIKDLGMPKDVADAFTQMVHKPHGIVLVTGPTGSGKTTTLYTALNEINSPECNVMTIEDPVEIRLPLVRQVQVNSEIGLTFAGALRSILRQDPDVILLGEIRDSETAKIAVQSALTGHLVFSTLHTNEAIGAIPRLREFGVPPFAINNALLGVMAQRLVRRVCADCAIEDSPDPIVLNDLGIKPHNGEKFYKGKGCPKCMSLGYRGRIGVYELLCATTGVRELIDRGAAASEIFEHARSEGMRLMLEDGVQKARLGLTSIEEVSKLHATIDIKLGCKDEDYRLSA
ncbi:MAG: type II/IV secretion system protein [Phycisphaerales bacterium]|nr:type II/IV secretion system protein [Phycisphaerales bacterium]